MESTLNVVAAIIIKDGKYLSVQRGHGKYKGKWEFPGGKIEEGDSSIKALVREIKEELDINIYVDSVFDNFQYRYPEFTVNLRCYLCSIKSGSIMLKEHLDLKWLTPETLLDVDWLPSDVLIARRLKSLFDF